VGFRVASGDPRTYADLAKPAGLADICSYANGVGANISVMIPLPQPARSARSARRRASSAMRTQPA
jgi:glycerophosphoryl diester phosphodiesterase